MSERLTIALAGNPNSGKTTIFNCLTGAHQHVGNYPGVTVEIKQGHVYFDGAALEVVDLPGTYSLTAQSEEELVARDFLVRHKPDAVIDVLDSSTVERQLYLAIQLLELGVPLVLAFNMSDVARHAGFEFDLPLLSNLLGVPIVQTVGNKGEGVEELLQTATDLARGETVLSPKPLSYGRDLDGEIDRIQHALDSTESSPIENVPSRWIALKLLENDPSVLQQFERAGGLPGGVSTALKEAHRRLSQLYPGSPEILVAEARYGIISGACSEAVRHTVESRHNISDSLDNILIHPLFGIPIFLVGMYLVFTLTFRLGDPIMSWLETFFGWLGTSVALFWPGGDDSPLLSLIVDGVIGGVGGVIVFLPNILLLFLGIALLEDSGYMARAAFIMDRMMHRIGLHGKSFIPMLIGFGCTVPAIMGTRILENRRDRLVMILILPLMSCGARLPIYALIIPAFFPSRLHGPMLWLIYVIGIVLGVILIRLLRGTVFRGESTPFVMELPPFRVPTLQGLLIHAWERGFMYLRKAGTIILAISIILWFATSFPKLSEERLEHFESEFASLRANLHSEVQDLIAGMGSVADSEGQVVVLERFAEGEIDLEAMETETSNSILTMTVEIQSARSGFEEIVIEEELIEGTPDYVLIRNDLERRLAKLEERDPDVFDAASCYLDDIYTPYIDGKAQLTSKLSEQKLTNSAVGRIAHWLTPVLHPMGFDWRIGSALIGAMAAKEVFVAQMGIVFSVGDVDEGSLTLREKLQENYTPLIGFCIMLFCLIGFPCVATVAVARAETGSWKWALLQHGGLTLLAWIITTLVYQVGTVAGWGV